MIRFGPMMGGPMPGMPGMQPPAGMPGMPNAPIVGFGNAMGGGSSPMSFGGGIKSLPGKIGGGISDWWGEMGALDKGQVVGGALGGLSQYLQQRKDNEFRDRALGLEERKYDDERGDTEDRQRRYLQWLASKGVTSG